MNTKKDTKRLMQLLPGQRDAIADVYDLNHDPDLRKEITLPIHRIRRLKTVCVEFMLVPWIEEWLCLGGEQAIIGKIRARTDIADLEVEACTWNMDGWVGI